MVNKKKQEKMPDQSPSGAINSHGPAGSQTTKTKYKSDNESLDRENVAEFVD
jgi:hypothetical protein